LDSALQYTSAVITCSHIPASPGDRDGRWPHTQRHLPRATLQPAKSNRLCTNSTANPSESSAEHHVALLCALRHVQAANSRVTDVTAQHLMQRLAPLSIHKVVSGQAAHSSKASVEKRVDRSLKSRNCSNQSRNGEIHTGRVMGEGRMCSRWTARSASSSRLTPSHKVASATVNWSLSRRRCSSQACISEGLA
jgi:hypothetical protein